MTTAPAQAGFDQQVHAGPVRAYIAAHSDTFGGEYIDTGNQGGPLWVVDFTAEVTQRQAELSHIFAAPSAMAVRQVANTWRSLLALSQRVAHDQPQIKAEGVDLLSWGPDPRTNRVALRLRSVDGRATAVLGSLYPATSILIVQGSQSIAVEGGGGVPGSSDGHVALWTAGGTVAAALGLAALWRYRRRPTAGVRGLS